MLSLPLPATRAGDGGQVSDDCPQCSSSGRVVTAVTVVTLGEDPRSVLVTRQCTRPGCHLKYPVLKPESDLTPEELALWWNR